MNGAYSYLFVKAVLTLGFVLVLLVVSLYVIKLYMNRQSGGGAKNGKSQGGSATVKVLHTSGLGAKKSLAIVDVAGEVLILGITPSSVNMLSKVEDAAAIEELKKRHSAKRPLFSLLQGGL